jgi:peptidoglycan hydrolase-like protein with peptidoglycan-binding domain
MVLQTPQITGDDVRSVQRRLLELGYRQIGNVDGVYGPRTAAAVQTFQTLNDLQVDGVVGPQTWQQLGSANATAAWAVTPIVETLLCDQHLLVGASYGDHWFDNRTSGLMVRGDETYRLYSGARVLGSAASTRVAAVEPAGPPYADQFLVSLSPDSGPAESIGVAGDWDAQPRTPITVTQETELRPYATALVDFLRSAGIAQPSLADAEAFTVWRVDLEGDGAEEALIGASRYITTPDSTTMLEGAYSVVLLQRTDGGTTAIEKIVANVYPDETQVFERTNHSLAAILELNGDGRLEIVVESSYFESAAVSVYGLDGGHVAQRLTVGCGV